MKVNVPTAVRQKFCPRTRSVYVNKTPGKLEGIARVTGPINITGVEVRGFYETMATLELDASLLETLANHPNLTYFE